MLLKITFKIFIFSLIINSLGARAQDVVIHDSTSIPQNEYIRWISQYPVKAANSQDKFGEKLVKILFGQNDYDVLSKPVSVLATDTNDYWVLDQGKGILFNIEDQVGDIPHFKNKEFKIFPSLVGICSFSGNGFLFTDSYLNKIFVVNDDHKDVSIFNDSLELNRPTGIAYNAVNQQVLVVETGGHCVSVLDNRGRLIKKFGARGDAPGQFNFPTYIWIDQFGKIFIVDSMNFRIQVFSANGELITIFGKVGDSSGSFARPRGIATDSDGNIYVVDALFNTVQIFDDKGNFLYNFGLQGQEPGQFWMPAGIYIDSNDCIYVADTYNSRVQIFKYLKAGF